ncbi:MAG: DUF3846 domain-containing protein [Clostridiales bacterium]|nr:DUF3846 domain-containing protein [Clostridiales bacterium]
MKYSVFYSELTRGLSLKTQSGIFDKSSIKRSFEAECFRDAIDNASEIWDEIKMTGRIPVLLVDQLEEPYFTSIRSNLHEYRRIVKGNIEMITCPDLKGIDIICNEEGKIMSLPLNRSLTDNHEVYDIVAGTMILAGNDHEGETIGLTEDQLVEGYNYFKLPQIFVLSDEEGEVEVLDCSIEMARIMKLNLIPNVSMK